MNRRHQIPAALFVLGLISLVVDLGGTVEAILYIVGGFFMPFGARMSRSNAGR